MTVTAVQPEHELLPNGKRIHFERTQTLAWKVIIALLAASFVAGLYFGLLQVDWHVWIGSLHFRIFYLKNWWDSLLPYNWWVLYRHGAFRDLAEPAIAVMGVLTLLAQPKYWNAKVSTLRLATAPLVILLLTFGLGIAGIWLLHFALPAAWAAIFGHHVLPYTAWLGKVSAGNLIIGAGIGLVLHRYWGPVGATIQGYQLDRAVDRAQARGRVPLWVRWPLSAPLIRKRFSRMWRENAVIDDVGTSRRLAIAGVTLFAILIVLLGLAGHYYVGVLHHTIPYLAP